MKYLELVYEYWMYHIGFIHIHRHGMYFLQTSAKSCDNVDRLFTEIAHELLQQVTQLRSGMKQSMSFQAKTKDLPSESHSVQNISEPIGPTSQVKQNCCSKVI